MRAEVQPTTPDGALGAGAQAFLAGRPSRLLGSVFGKDLRDARRSVFAVSGALVVLMVVQMSQFATQFPTPADRQQLVVLSLDFPPAIRALLGRPIHVDRLGGFISWRSMNALSVLLALWSAVAMSGTLAGEARSGSLELLGTTPLSRRRIALEKALAHVAAIGAACAVVGVSIWLGAAVWHRLPGDEVDALATASHMLWLGLVALASGSVAFAAAPLVGRGAAAGLGAVVAIAVYLVDSFAGIILGFDVLRPLSWYAWTGGHRPLAGVSDLGSLVPLGALCAVLLGAGVVAFERRDVGTFIPLRLPRLPGARVSLRGPLARSLAERAPGAVAWGAGAGAWAFLAAVSADTLARTMGTIAGAQRIVRAFYPGIDLSTAAGILQLAFFAFATFIFGVVAAALVAGWASDEQERRTELLLTTPVARARWALMSGAGVLAAMGVSALITGLCAVVGALAVGDDAVGPFVGTLVVGLYGAALAGVGLAVGGLFGPRPAAVAVAAIAVGSFMVDLIANALRLPRWFGDLLLVRHLGSPMIGRMDWPGLAVCAVLALGGVAVCAWGMARRDLNG